MIFVTVGEQLPFDRLIQTIDEWAKKNDEKVFAQTGNSIYKPKYVEFKNFLNPQEFEDIVSKADCIVGHAGMGTIIAALERGKPLIVLPRQAKLGEHRNDHQYATAKKFMKLNYIEVAFNETELLKKLNGLEKVQTISPKNIEPSPRLLKTIADFISA